jgi:hypothetical protein
MTASVSVDYYGLKEALRELQKVSPALRKEISQEMLGIVRETLVPPIQDSIPSTAPLQGMKHSGRTSWTRQSQTKGVVAKIDTRKARRRNLQQGAQWESVGVVKVITKTAALAIVDMAGRGPNQTRNRNPKLARPNFVDDLTSKLGRGPSRFIWFAGERNVDATLRRLEKVVEKVADATTGNIVRR